MTTQKENQMSDKAVKPNTFSSSEDQDGSMEAVLLSEPTGEVSLGETAGDLFSASGAIGSHLGLNVVGIVIGFIRFIGCILIYYYTGSI